MKRNMFFVFALIVVMSFCACGRGNTGSRDQSAENTGMQNSGPTWQEQYDLGVRYLSDGNYQEAIIAFTAAIEIDPRQTPAYVGRGDAYVLLGETEENLTAAQMDYEKAVELDSTYAEAYLGLADVYIRQGDYEKALEILCQGLEEIGENQAISNKIAEMESGNITDSFGNTRRMSVFNGNGDLQYWHDFTYGSQGMPASVTSYDANGIQTGYVDLVFGEKGERIVSYGYSELTGEVSKLEFEYDDNGNCIKELTYDGDALSHYELYEFDEFGNETRREQYTADGYLTIYFIYKFDENGNMIQCDEYDHDGNRTNQNLFKYDAKGQLIQEDFYSYYESCWHSIIHEYDDAGNLIMNSCYDEEGNLESYTVYRYDLQGNYTGFDDYDSEGNLLQSTSYD